MADEAVFPIRYPTDTSGIAKGVTELERLRSALQQDQKEIAGMQKAMASLKLDPDVQAFQKMQSELRKLGAEEDKAAKKVKELQAKRAEMVSKGASAKQLADFDVKGGEAVGQLWKTQDRIQGLRKSIADIETKPAVRQFKDLDLALKSSQGQLASNQSKYLALGGDVTQIGETVKEAKSGFDELTEGLDKAGVGAGGLKSKLEALKALGPAGIAAALVVTVVALGVALAKTAFDLTMFAVGAGDAARSMSILHEAAAGSQSGGRALDAMVRRLRNDFAGSREEISGMVLDLRRAGLAGVHLERTVRLTGIAAKTMGQGAAGILKGLIERGKLTKRFSLNFLDLKGTGLEYDDVARQLAKMTGRTIGTVRSALYSGQVKLADGIQALEAAVKLRFGDLAKRQLLALPEQISRARENLKDIFATVNPGRFLSGLAGVLELLDETTETGKSLRVIAKTVFQPFIDFVGSNVFPLIRGFFLGMTLAVIELSIASIKAYLWFKKSFGDVGLFAGIDGAKLAFYAGATAVFALVAAVGALTAILAVGAAMFVVITAPIWGLFYAIYKVIKGLSDLRKALAAKFSPPKLDATGIGDGAAAGIKASTPKVEGAMRDMAKSGVKAFKSELEMASPSELLKKEAMVGIGGGVAGGVDASRGMVEQSMRRLVNPKDAIPSKASLTGGATTGPITIQFGDIIVQGNGQGGINQASFVQQLAEGCEDALRQLGLRPVLP